MGENSIGLVPDWEGVEVTLANRKRGRSDPAASATSLRDKPSYLFTLSGCSSPSKA